MRKVRVSSINAPHVERSRTLLGAAAAAKQFQHLFGENGKAAPLGAAFELSVKRSGSVAGAEDRIAPQHRVAPPR